MLLSLNNLTYPEKTFNKFMLHLVFLREEIIRVCSHPCKVLSKFPKLHRPAQLNMFTFTKSANSTPTRKTSQFLEATLKCRQLCNITQLNFKICKAFNINADDSNRLNHCKTILCGCTCKTQTN